MKSGLCLICLAVEFEMTQFAGEALKLFSLAHESNWPIPVWVLINTAEQICATVVKLMSLVSNGSQMQSQVSSLHSACSKQVKLLRVENFATNVWSHPDLHGSTFSQLETTQKGRYSPCCLSVCVIKDWALPFCTVPVKWIALLSARNQLNLLNQLGSTKPSPLQWWLVFHTRSKSRRSLLAYQTGLGVL